MIIEIARLLIEVQSLADIKEYIESKGNKDSDKIISKAFAVILEDQNISQEIRQAWCLEAYRDIYRKLVETGDYSGALKAIKEIAALTKPSKKSQDRPMEGKEAISVLNKKRLSIVQK